MSDNGVQELVREAARVEYARVKFGPGRTQDLPVEWAEIMLTELKNGHAALFGKLLTKAATEAK
jgi:hypothetical protein